MKAELIYNNCESTIRPHYGSTPPKPDQDQGTIAERLSECAGRICYDSYGKGRSSAEYHQHILEVGHLSVYEHFNLTVAFPENELSDVLLACINRPGIWVDTQRCRITYNLRVVLDWEKFGPPCVVWLSLYNTIVSRCFPTLYALRPEDCFYEVVPPESKEEIWLSFYIRCSRGCSHELVRHGDRTAISQRSTRYVDESESDWIMHPDLEKQTAYGPGNIEALVGDCQTMYRNLVTDLEPKVGRKQARGAARGLLGNALSTELVFSASLAQWRRMVEQRAHSAADAEIRQLFERNICPVLSTLP